MNSYIYTLSTRDGIKYDYASVYQNTVFFDQISENFHYSDRHLENLVANSDYIATIIQDLQTTTQETILIDIRYISMQPVHTFEDCLKLIAANKNRRIYLVFSEQEFKSHVEQSLINCKQYQIHDISDSVLLVTSKQREDFLNLNNGDIAKMIDDSINFHIYSLLKEENDANFKQQAIYILSSNTHVNHYVNAKECFYRNDILMLVLFAFIRKIINKQRILSNVDPARAFSGINMFDAFICASVNGACLASALSVFIKKPVIYLNNIGPNLSVKDEHIINKIIPKRKYAFIFDFMCLGTEFSRIKMLCAIKQAALVYSLGISHYILPKNKTGEPIPIIETLFDINEYDHDYYCCAASEHGLMKIIGK